MNIKKLLFKLIVSFLLSSLVSNLFAGTIFILPGGKAMGMGGAFVAVADDATAIYWNPAGLAQQKDAGLEFAGFYASAPARASKPLTNTTNAKAGYTDFPIPQVYPSEPSEFSSKPFETSAMLPFIGGYKRLDDTTVLGFGAYVTAGGGGKWESIVKGVAVNNDPNFGSFDGSTDDILAKVDASYGVMIFNISGAKTLSDKLSVGLGVNIAYMEDESKAIKTYTNNGGNPVPSYNIQIDQKATGYGYEAMAGAMYKATDKLDLAMVFRTGANIKLNGKANYNNTALVANSLPTSYSTNYTEDYRYPMTLGVGGSYFMTEKLRLAAEVDYLNYSTMQRYMKYDDVVNVEGQDTFTNENTNSGWEDTIMYSLGAEYKYTDKLSFLAGWQYEPSPYPQNKLTLLGTDQYSFNNFCIGCQYEYKQYKFSLGITKSFQKSISQDGISYDYEAEIYRFNVGYNF